MGYRRLEQAARARGDSLDVVTPDRFPALDRWHARWRALFLPLVVAVWLWRRRRQYDVALFHSYTGWMFNLLPARLPTITAFHGVEPLAFEAFEAERRAQGLPRLSRRYRLVHGWMMRHVLQWTCRRSRRVTCLNAEERSYLLDRGWTTADRLVVLHHGVTNEFFVDRRDYAPRARRILWVAQWLELKGVHYLVEAFAALAREHADLELWCCGTRIPSEVVLRSFPEDVRNRVTVKAELRHDELSADLRAADIFVHTALNEAYGRAIAEAMASALPIVVTPVGVAIDLLQDGRDCLIVPKADARALALAIGRLLDNVELRKKLGGGARRVAATLTARERDAVVLDLLSEVVADAGAHDERHGPVS